MKFCLSVALLAVAMVMVNGQFFGAGPFNTAHHSAVSDAAAAHHDAAGEYAQNAATGLLDTHHNENHDMTHDLANGYGLHEHDEQHHGLADGLHQEYAARAAQGANAVHNDAAQSHSALAAANTFGHGHAPYAAYGHGVYGHGPYGHGPYGHGLYGHGLYGHGPYGHGLYGHGAFGHGLNAYAPLVGHGLRGYL
uniref:Histidine rich beak protein 2 n=1 Tax=Dosidicus gigas TaxID=346249 RepID=A0A0G2UHG9_DOSGI|nr:histidine rich beak protein 2 [Dosidicus gigas]